MVIGAAGTKNTYIRDVKNIYIIGIVKCSKIYLPLYQILEMIS